MRLQSCEVWLRPSRRVGAVLTPDSSLPVRLRARSGTAGGLRTHVGGRGARAERGGADGQRSGGTGWDGGEEWAGGADGCSGGTGRLHGTSGQVAHTACTGETEECQSAVGAPRIDCCATATQRGSDLWH